jgi:pantothenate kinase
MGWYSVDIRSKRERETMMKTMMIAVGGVYADYHMIGKEIEIVRVYRTDAMGFLSKVFDDPIMIDHAKFTIKAVKAGWMTIGKSK